MKLNRQNKAILKSLDGEYKKFGKKVKSAVLRTARARTP